jgi:uncharacterized protein (TIGR00297 family)
MELISLTAAAGIAAGISLAGVLARALTPIAGVVATVVGFAVGAGTGWPGLAALGAFFVSSSLFSRLTESSQPRWIDSKGNRRDQWQVIANGGVAALGGAIGAMLDPRLGLWMVLPSLAAAGADTWATSIGALSRSDPLHLLRWVRVPKGTSGGVSLIGTAGGMVGSGVIALVPLLFGAPMPLAGASLCIGTVGMVADSILGATVQGRFECPACGLSSERQLHRCGTATRLVGGVRWIGNDAVNLIATALAGLAGWGWWWCCWH